MDFKNLQIDDQQDQESHEPNKDMKIQLLDGLIDKIMGMPDDADAQAEGSPEVEGLETPALEAKETILGKEDPLQLGGLDLKDKLEKTRGC